MQYLTQLYNCFSGKFGQSKEAEKIRQKLSGQLSQEQRRLLLAYSDELYAYCDEISFRSFVAGFRLAAGIAAELHQSWDQPNESNEAILEQRGV